MTDTELALMKQYEWIIPKQPIPLCQVIEALSKNFMQFPLKAAMFRFYGCTNTTLSTCRKTNSCN